jgi:hypothetical protein
MRTKLFVTALLLFLSALGAGAQQDYITGSTPWGAEISSIPSTYGPNVESYSGTAGSMSEAPANVLGINLIYITQNGGLSVTDGYIYMGSGGTIGDKVDFLIIPATDWDHMGSTVQCHATFTETTGTINAWTHYTFSGCYLTQGFWFIGYNTNDNGLGISFWTCYGPGSMANTGSCVTGSSRQTDTGEFGAFYQTGVTYGTYTGLPTGAINGTQNTTQDSVYIKGLPIGTPSI